MTWGRYSTEPTNQPLTALQVIQSSVFAPAVLNAVQDPRLRGYLVDKSVPWDAVDLPLVTDLPRSPKDRAEVNYLIDETNEVVVRMVYRASTGNWVQVGKPPVVTSLPTGVDGMEVNYLIDSTNSIHIRMLYTGGAWVEIGKVPIVTAIPAVAYQGYQIIYDTGTAGIRWHFVYDSSDGTTYPWLFIGGPPLRSDVATSQSRANAAYGALATAGPSLTNPLAGDWDLGTGARVTSPSGELAMYSYTIAGGAALDVDAVFLGGSASTVDGYTHRINRRTSVSASTAFVANYRSSGGASATFENRYMTLTPVRVV